MAPIIESSTGLPSSLTADQKLLDRYLLKRRLGQGATGIVWLAWDEKLENEVALKFLPDDLVEQVSGFEALKNETRRSLELSHPNIVRTFDFVKDGNLVGISMEYVEGGSVRSRQRGQPEEVFEPAALGGWVRQLCNALDYAHSHAGIIHRDLKPANLLLDARHQLKVADFGFADGLEQSLRPVTGAQAPRGTLVYMSPQQLAGEKADVLDDVYAVGATLYELCTRKPPFYMGDIESQVKDKVPPSMTERRRALGVSAGDLPAEWESTIAACLAKDPAQRPRSAGEIATRLQIGTAIVAPPPGIAPVPGASLPPGAALPSGSRSPSGMEAWRQTFRRPPVLIGALAVLLLLVFLAAWVAGGRAVEKGGKPNDIDPALTHITPVPKTMEAPVAPRTLEQRPAPPAAVAAGSGALLDIVVKSEPERALVRLDGKLIDRTPATLEKVAPGQHVLSVELAGYDNYTQELNLDGSQVPTQRIQLVRSRGSLAVTTNDPTATIQVTGPENPSTTPGSWHSDRLLAGDYIVTVTRAGWEPIAKPATVNGGQPSSVAFDLTPGRVSIESTPPGASVQDAGGQEVGKTPAHLEAAPGDVHYTVTLSGYNPEPAEGKVEAGQELPLQVTLTKAGAAKAETSRESTRSGTRHPRKDDDEDRSRPGTGIGHKFKTFFGFGKAAPTPSHKK